MINVKKDTEEYNQVKEEDKIRVLSLFSGCGGMDLGFEGGFAALAKSISNESGFIEKVLDDHFVLLKKNRFKTVFANDILPAAKKTWINHFQKLGYSSDLYFDESIVDLVKRHKNGENIFPEDIDIVTGGFPCQDFSVAGKRNGFNSHKDHNGKTVLGDRSSDETRGKLYYWMKEVIDITKPKMFIAENVKGLVNLNDVKDIIQKDFSTAAGGYIVFPPRVLKAADYGVPQSRERVIFIGIRVSALKQKALFALSSALISDEYNPYPLPTHSSSTELSIANKLLPPVVLKDIFNQLSEPENSDDISQRYYSKAKYMGSHCQGQIEISLNKVGPTIRSEHHGNIEFRRLSREHGGVLLDELAKGYSERRLTVRECAMIQTFPPDYEFIIKDNHYSGRFIVSSSAAYKVVGNAVPPLLAYHIAKRIENIWSLYFD